MLTGYSLRYERRLAVLRLARLAPLRTGLEAVRWPHLGAMIVVCKAKRVGRPTPTLYSLRGDFAAAGQAHWSD